MGAAGRAGRVPRSFVRSLGTGGRCLIGSCWSGVESRSSSEAAAEPGGVRDSQEVRGRPADGGGGLRGCVLEPGSVPAVAASPTPLPGWQPLVARAGRAPVGLDLSPSGDPAVPWDPFRRPAIPCSPSRLLQDIVGSAQETLGRAWNRGLGPVERYPAKANVLGAIRPGCSKQVGC